MAVFVGTKNAQDGKRKLELQILGLAPQWQVTATV